jgi:hypothetical protein
VRVFYLGAPNVAWLASLPVPLCVSYARLEDCVTVPERLCDPEGTPYPFIIDSKAFSEVSKNGRWTVPPLKYAKFVSAVWDRNMGLQWAGIQDLMCEEIILRKTGMTIAEHQLRTVYSYELLSHLAPRVVWAPTLQGAEPADYLAHFDLYTRRGHDLTRARVVGIGSVCRRQRTSEIDGIFNALAPLGLKLHGYGVKKLGLERGKHILDSSDSMAWSQDARYGHKQLPGHQHGDLVWRKHLKDGPLAPLRGRFDYGNCANCSDLALQYYREVHRRFVQ